MLGEQLSVCIPEGYQELLPEEKNNFFQSRKPELTLWNKENHALLTFSQVEGMLTPDNLPEKLAQYAYSYSRSVPGFQRGPFVKKQQGNLLMGAFQYQSTSLEQDFFNILVLIRLDGGTAVMTLHGDRQKSRMEGIKFMQILSSIQMKEKTAEEEKKHG